jgi:acetyl-CoA/propionyl-CoA carboxylase biotin carboxyl carrier protein
MSLGLPADLLCAFGGASAAAAAAASPAAADELDPASLRSTMGATVVKWLASSGATVAEGDPVLVLEAMKMESTVTAHRTGVLGDLRVSAGDVVAVAQELATITA